MEIASGTLEFRGGFSQPDGTLFLASGTYRSPDPLNLAGGQLIGWGLVNADVTNAATIHPSPSNGVITIQGRYTQRLNGNLEFSLAGQDPGVDQSRLDVQGPAHVAGSVSVHLAEAYLPSPGTEFEVMTFAERTGNFTCFNGFILLGQGRRLTTLWEPTLFRLTTITAEEPVTVPLSVGAAIGDGAVVCWPWEFVGWDLYSNTNLSQTNWIRVDGITNRYFAPAPVPPQKFFRLLPE